MHEVLCDELQACGVEIPFEDCLSRFMGKSIEGVIETAIALGAQLPDGWKDTLYQKVHARLAAGVDLIPGVFEFVQSLKARGIPFCVASNGSETKMRLMLSQHGLWDDFKEVCFSAQTIGVSKPDPGLLRHVVAAMGSPNNPVVVEDSLVGLRSAQAASIPCVLLSESASQSQSADDTVRAFARMCDLAGYVLSLGREVSEPIAQRT